MMYFPDKLATLNSHVYDIETAVKDCLPYVNFILGTICAKCSKLVQP